MVRKGERGKGMGHWFLFAQNSLLRIVPHPNAFLSSFLSKRETGRQRETERYRERQRETERDRERDIPLAHTTTHHHPACCSLGSSCADAEPDGQVTGSVPRRRSCFHIRASHLSINEGTQGMGALVFGRLSRIVGLPSSFSRFFRLFAVQLLLA